MILGDYLKEKMMPHKAKVAFANLGITYEELLTLGSEKAEKKFMGKSLRRICGAWACIWYFR